MADTTTLQVREETRDLLKKIGGGKSYDEIILELLEMREAFITDLLDKFKYMEEHPEEGITLEEHAERENISL